MLPFQNSTPTPAGDWRHIVRFGRNVASYKFAPGHALLELAARQQTYVPLPELEVPYAVGLCEHLQVEDRQSTSAQSPFLDACRSRNRGDLEAAQLAEAKVRLGFANVIDAFHVSRGGQHGWLAHQKALFLFGVLIADDDSEPHVHCSPKSLQGLDVRHTTAQFNT